MPSHPRSRKTLPGMPAALRRCTSGLTAAILLVSGSLAAFALPSPSSAATPASASNSPENTPAPDPVAQAQAQASPASDASSQDDAAAPNGQVSRSAPLTSVEKSFPALDILPPGTILKNVRLPRYRDFQLTGLLSAASMKVEDASRISGKMVRVNLINPDGAAPTKALLDNACYNFKLGTLTATGGVSLSDPRFAASGATLNLDVNTHRGFLSGPVTTSIFQTQKLPAAKTPPAPEQKQPAPQPVSQPSR